MLQLGPDLFELLNAKQKVGNQQPVIYGKGGLSTLQIQLIEKKLGFRVPPDFSFLLQNVRDPGGVLFPWAQFTRQGYDEMIAWVFKGIEFDIRHGFWLKRWGTRPDTLSEALDIARRDFPSWPKLLPVHGHRFLAAEPCRAENPVFSIMQIDIIYYGANLAHYLLHEFVDGPSDDRQKHTYGQQINRIEIWSDFVDRHPDFLTWPRVSESVIRGIAANLRARSSAPARPFIQVQLQPDGTFLLDGQVVDLIALEEKLRELPYRNPPPDVRVLDATPEKPESPESCSRLLEKYGFSIVMALEWRGDKLVPVEGTVWSYI